jgi:hypothetical protein
MNDLMEATMMFCGGAAIARPGALNAAVKAAAERAARGAGAGVMPRV